jgi:SOCE-associated regulatory factor of calcium homoeostasis
LGSSARIGTNSIMYLSHLYPIFLALLALLDSTIAAKKPSNSVLLTQVKTLTLRKDAKTSHRRVPAIPQLKCVGGSGRGLYDIDVMQCKNQGSDYDDDNVQWTCTATLPEEFKLGSTDVICEGYDSPQDPYILKGSCGVEYRLLLTDKGEEKYGSGIGSMFKGYKKGTDWGGVLFTLIFIAVAGWIIYSALIAYQGAPRARRPPRNGGFWGGGWGGGGGGGGNDPFDPPPPYPGPRKNYSTRAAPGVGEQGWRPGFWTGVLGGAAAGYMAGNRGGRQEQYVPPPRTGWFGGNNGNAWGNSGWRSAPTYRPGSSSSSSSSSSRHQSTGFGSTSRR